MNHLIHSNNTTNCQSTFQCTKNYVIYHQKFSFVLSSSLLEFSLSLSLSLSLFPPPPPKVSKIIFLRLCAETFHKDFSSIVSINKIYIHLSIHPSVCLSICLSILFLIPVFLWSIISEFNTMNCTNLFLAKLSTTDSLSALVSVRTMSLMDVVGIWPPTSLLASVSNSSAVSGGACWGHKRSKK